ncbi:MAG: PH domain-containing protein [Alphaproteobacteria bacterium]|nr:PH domain-containing protein [Alphaproteobacteria bacterium]
MHFSIRPVFVGWITFLQQLPFQLFLTFWAGMFFGGMAIAANLFDKKSDVPFIFSGALAFVGVFLVAYIGKKLNYDRTEYKFYDDRLEFEEGFFTINKKIIKYKDIREVTLRKGILQRACGLGTIYLATLATGSTSYASAAVAFGFGNVSASGICVRDISEPDEMYEKIKTLVDVKNS